MASSPPPRALPPPRMLPGRFPLVEWGAPPMPGPRGVPGARRMVEYMDLLEMRDVSDMVSDMSSAASIADPKNASHLLVAFRATGNKNGTK